MSNAPCYTSVFKAVYIYMRIAEICHYLSSIQRWDNFSSVVDNLQDVLVEKGQGGKGQKIQEDSAAKSMILLSLSLLYCVIIFHFVLYYLLSLLLLLVKEVSKGQKVQKDCAAKPISKI